MLKGNSSTYKPMGDCGHAERQQLHLQTHGRLCLCRKATAPFRNPWVAILKGNSSSYKPMGDCVYAKRQQLHLQTHGWLFWKATAPLTNPWEIVARLKGSSSTYKPMGGYIERQQLHLQTHGRLWPCWNYGKSSTYERRFEAQGSSNGQGRVQTAEDGAKNHQFANPGRPRHK